MVLRPHRLSWDAFELRQQHLHPTDAVVLEATTNAWHLYDQVVPCVASVVVANPLLVRWMSSATIKTDGHDALKLARLLAAGLIPAVWVSREPVRPWRALVSHRHRLIRQRTQARHRLQCAPTSQPHLARRGALCGGSPSVVGTWVAQDNCSAGLFIAK